MAYDQGITFVKFTNKDGIQLPNIDWIAGVDYDDYYNEQDDEDYQQQEETEVRQCINDDESLQANKDINAEEIEDILNESREQGQQDCREDQDKEESNPTNEERDKEESNPTNDEREIEEIEHILDGDDEPPELADKPEDYDSEDEEEEEDDYEEEEMQEVRRSNRTKQQQEMTTYNELRNITTMKKQYFQCINNANIEEKHNLFHSNEQVNEYTENKATVIGRYMGEINSKYTTKKSFVQQYMLEKGIAKYGNEGKKAANDEMQQLHERECFTPVRIGDLNRNEWKKVQMALLYLSQKRDSKIKGRCVYNGKPTREWLGREESASPTVALESIMLTAVIDTYEGHDVMTADVPNAFIQMPIEQIDGKD